MAQPNIDDLEGTTYRVYVYAVKEGKPVNTRDVRKGVNLSSPSVAYRHLQKLETLGLLERNEYGDYVVKEKINVSGNIWVGRNLVPRFVIYSLFFAGLLIVEILTIVMNQVFDVTFVYLIILTVTAIGIFSAEGIVFKRKSQKKIKRQLYERA
jgi:hypothetical protein